MALSGIRGAAFRAFEKETVYCRIQRVFLVSSLPAHSVYIDLGCPQALGDALASNKHHFKAFFQGMYVVNDSFKT